MPFPPTQPRPRSSRARAAAELAFLLVLTGCSESPDSKSSTSAPLAGSGASSTAISPVQAALIDGVRLANEGRFEEAVATFDRGLRLEPDNAKLRHEKGIALLQMGSAAQAEAEFTLGIEAEPGRWDNWSQRGATRFQMGRLSEAEADLVHALELNPNNELAHYNLGYLRESRAMVVLGAVSLDVEQMELAAQSYQRALELLPAHDAARARLAGVLNRLGRKEEARKAYAEVLERNPKQELALLECARLEVETGAPEAAAPLLARLLEQRPDSAEGLYLSGQVAEEMGELQSARDNYEKAIAQDGSLAHALYRLAAVQEALGESAAAEQTRARHAEVEALGREVSEKLAAVNSQPENPMLRYQYARSLARAQRIDQALAAYNQLLSLPPQQFAAADPKLMPQAWLEAGVLHLEKKHNAKAARTCFENTLNRQPNFPLAHALAGKACLGLDDNEAAIEHLKAALQGAPNLIEAHSNLGIAFVKQGRWVDAIGALEAGLAKAPKHVTMQYNLAGAYLARGSVEQAKAMYERLLEQDPEHADARARLAQIAEQAQAPQSAASQPAQQD